MLFLQAQMRPEGGCSPLRRRLSLLILLIVLIFPLFAGRVRSASTVCAIHVDVEQKMLTLFCGSEIAARYPIATGARDTPTPLGVFCINRRFSGEMGGFGTCFLGLNVPWGDYGIHGTNRPESIGTNASHGCIRMRVADAEALYARVPNGTVVVIECGAYGELGGSLRTLKNGDRSSMVRAVQRKLRALGFYFGTLDGIFGAATQRAVDKARETFRLSSNGLVDWALYQKLGLTLFE